MTATHRLPHRRGLDGLRALAVTGVLLYHADVSWMPGGFLGVDVFFTISGYLITSLLLAEVVASGRVSLPAFWKRRARRLLPALGALLVGVSVAALATAHDAAGRLRGDILAALGWSSNWWQIIRGETYFETLGRPPLLRHLWSLAVEEQLYLVLPVVVAVLAGRRWLRHRRALGIGVLVAAALSTVLLRALWNADDPSRAWYGTDTRSAGLLVGVAMALLWPMASRPRWKGIGRRGIDVIAWGSVIGLVIVAATVGERDASLPRWGFALTAALSGAAVVAVTSPTSRAQRYLGIRPLRWLGTRSYAVYLWHWPVFVLSRPPGDVRYDGAAPLLARLLATAVLAELSWRLVERPVRTGALARAWFGLRRTERVRIATVSTAAVIVLAVSLAAGLTATSVEPPELLAATAASPTASTTLVDLPATTAPTPSTTTPSTTTPSATTAAPVSPPPSTTTTTAPPPPTVPPEDVVLAVGDSVMLAARDALVSHSGGRVYVDAATARSVDDGLDVLQRYRDIGAFMQVSAVVVHLGTNGTMDDDQFNRLAVIVAGVPRVVVLNVRVPKQWEERTNAAINGGTGRFEAMRLGDWYTASAEPGALAGDGVHPSPSGARIYAYVVMQGLSDPPVPEPVTTTTSTSSTTTAVSTTAAPPAATG